MSIFPEAASNPSGLPNVQRAIASIQASHIFCLPEVTALPTYPVDNQVLIYNHTVQWYDNGTWSSMGGGGGGIGATIAVTEIDNLDNSGLSIINNSTSSALTISSESGIGIVCQAGAWNISCVGAGGASLDSGAGDLLLSSGNTVQITYGAYGFSVNSSSSQYMFIDPAGQMNLSCTRVGFFGAPVVVQQTGGSATAAGSYTATEQGMIQRMYDALRNYGLLT